MGFSLFRRAPFPWLGHPIVKSRMSAGIRRNLNRILCFCDANRFSEIGFARHICADLAILFPLIRSPCFSAPSGSITPGRSGRSSRPSPGLGRSSWPSPDPNESCIQG